MIEMKYICLLKGETITRRDVGGGSTRSCDNRRMYICNEGSIYQMTGSQIMKMMAGD